MTRHHTTTDTVPRPTPPERTPRLRLKPKAPHTGYVDGAWWPYSDDLVAELPDLLAMLAVRLGPVDRVLCKAGDWTTAPVEFDTADGSGIVGDSIDSRMKSRPATHALANPVARRGDAAGCVVHSDRGSNF